MYPLSFAQYITKESKVKIDRTCCEDFFVGVLYAVMSAFGMSSLEDTPSDTCFSNFSNKSEQQRKQLLRKDNRNHRQALQFKKYQSSICSQESIQRASVIQFCHMLIKHFFTWPVFNGACWRGMEENSYVCFSCLQS